MDLVQANMGWERRIMVLAQPSLELAQPNLELKQPNLALEQPTLELTHSIVRLEQRKVAMQFEFICPTNFSLSPDFDKLKLIGHQTASLPGIRISQAH